MGIPQEYAYHEGFTDSQIKISDDVFEIVNENGGWEDAILEIKEYFTLLKQELDSL